MSENIPESAAPLGATAKLEKTNAVTSPLKIPLASKDLRESLYFAASLEREALRLVTRNPSFESATLFSVLSYAFEIEAGTKKSAPANLDCSRYKIEKKDQTTFQIFKICQKPTSLVATMKSDGAGNNFDIEFFSKEWPSVLGLSVTLINPNIRCQLRLKDKKLQTMNCQHWSYLLPRKGGEVETEIRLSTWMFHRDQQVQLKLTGGFFKELVERSKIDVQVPLQGKIKLIEKELEFKDDFAEKPKVNEVPTHVEKDQNEKSQQEGGVQGFKKGEGEKQSTPGEVKEGRTEEGKSEGGQESSGPAQDFGQGQSGTPTESQVGPAEGFPAGDPGGAPESQQPVEVEQDQNNGGVPKPGRRGR